MALYTNTICTSLSCMWESAPPLFLYRQAEELAEDIVGMRNYLGDKFMPLHKYPDFPRGVVECGSQTLISAQYFEEIPFYGPPRPCGHEPMQITKFYEWQAVKVTRVSFFLIENCLHSKQPFLHYGPHISTCILHVLVLDYENGDLVTHPLGMIQESC